MLKCTGILLLAFITACGSDDSASNNSSDPPADPPTNELALSTSFGSVGCGNASCHGPEGKGSNLTHDPNGEPWTNLTTSERALDWWTDWVRNSAKSPMPTYSDEQYSTSDLENDYQFLTGRTE